MPRRCPGCQLAALRQRSSVPRPREDGSWRQMAARPPRATRRAASTPSGPPRRAGEWRSPCSDTLVWAWVPNSGRCLCACLCTTWHTQSRLTRAAVFLFTGAAVICESHRPWIVSIMSSGRTCCRSPAHFMNGRISEVPQECPMLMNRIFCLRVRGTVVRLVCCTDQGC